MSGLMLSAVEARVLGSLIEKEMTTPDYYPLTLNALLAACNQSSNRDPVVSYAEATVTEGIEGLREKQLVRWVKEARSRAAKYRHDLAAVPGLDEAERALVAVLLLRGPQTAGELRTRTERYHRFDDLEAVESVLGALSAREDPITEKLARRPGQKEARWRLRWVEDTEAAVPAGDAAPAGTDEARRRPPPAVESVSDQAEAAAESELAELRRRLNELAERVGRLERELGLD